MTLLHRRRSSFLAFSSDPFSKPPPNPFPSNASLENVARPTKLPPKVVQDVSPGRKNSSGIMRRVSLMFTPKKRKPPSLVLSNKPVTSMPYLSPGLESVAESFDDIRRPSGLGSPVAMYSNVSLQLPPSPLTPERLPFSNSQIIGVTGYHRHRAVSSPSLLTSFNKSTEANSLSKRASMAAPQVIVSRPPPPTDHVIAIKAEIPEEVIIMILSFLPRKEVIAACRISHAFFSAGRSVLYSNLVLDSLSSRQLEKLIVLLASRQDLTDRVQRITCSTWPSFFSTPFHQATIINPDVQHQNTLLTATFTIAFQRMSNITHLVMPSFDASLLAHHTAFGLRSITFLNRTMSSAETSAMFSWLDGQINITALYLPNLFEESAPSSKNDTETQKSIIQEDTPYSNNTHSLSFLSLVHSNASPISTPRPTSYSPSIASKPSMFTFTTLMPNLTHLRAPPSISTLLTSTPSNASPSSFRRPLKEVSLNINTTLYGGLRPVALFAPLQGISRLSLHFSANVDRRTVEKVLGAAGSALGSPPSLDTSATLNEAINNNATGGLSALEVEFIVGSNPSPGTTEVLYKIIQTVLPRYPSLCELRLVCSDSESSQTGPPTEYPSRTGELTFEEQIRVDIWTKHCPALRLIQLISGVIWKSK